MRLVIVFIVTFYCLYHHVSGNQQQDPNDPNRPFWATRGRRSGARLSIKADDDIPEKWAEEDLIPEPILNKDVLLHKRDQATTLLQSLLNALSTWDGEVRKRGDSKNPDPNNPFWAARG